MKYSFGWSEHDFENIISALRTEHAHREEVIASLITENKTIKDEKFADKTIQSLQAENKELRKTLAKSFQIGAEEWENIHNWQKEHMETYHSGASGGAIGGNFEFSFIPTSIGDIGTCICSSCRRIGKSNFSYTFRELE